MLIRVLLAAIAAGLIGGVFATAAQAVRVTPLVIAAEAYENAPAAQHQHGTSGADSAHVHSGGEQPVGGQVREESGWTPANGVERTLYTLMTNMLIGAGYALLVTAAIVLTNQPADMRHGLVWGLAGFVIFVLAPNLGLPPELPGTAAAALEARQLWWLATVVCTGAGLAIFAFKRHFLWVALGVALIAAPHVWGAPKPALHESLVPASLAVEFVTASIATAFVFWLFLGGVLGYLLSHALRAEERHETARGHAR